MLVYMLPLCIAKVGAIIFNLHLRPRIAKQWTHKLQRIEDSTEYGAEAHTLFERERERERER